MKDFFKSLFSEDVGTWSFTRVLSFVVVMTILVVWIYACISTGTYVDFGQYSFLIILSVIGGKVAQKFVEVRGQVQEKQIDAKEHVEDPDKKPDPP